MQTRIFRGKEQIYCDFRRKWVRLTPEEWVRQQFLHRMVEELHYPMSFIGVEIPIRIGEATKRCDAIVFQKNMQPCMLLEFKAEDVPLTQKTLDQAATYNRKVKVPYLILHNGPQTIIAVVDGSSIHYLNTIPLWTTF